MFLSLFNALVRKKERVLRIFYIFWIFLGVCLLLALKSHTVPDVENYIFWHRAAILSGKTALIFLFITLLPGIFKRFGIRNRLLGLIMIFRRQFGITMFLLALFHGLIVSLVDAYLDDRLFKFLLFEWMGIIALTLLFLLFITSNNFSQERLGIWWWHLHRVVYLIMWLILIHLALQSWQNSWTWVAAALVVAEMSGIIYSNLKRLYSKYQAKI